MQFKFQRFSNFKKKKKKKGANAARSVTFFSRRVTRGATSDGGRTTSDVGRTTSGGSGTETPPATVSHAMAPCTTACTMPPRPWWHGGKKDCLAHVFATPFPSLSLSLSLRIFATPFPSLSLSASLSLSREHMTRNSQCNSQNHLIYKEL